MTQFYDWFSGLATIGGFLYFLTGFAAAYVFECIKAKIKNRKIKIQWQLAGIVIGVVALVISTVQSQVAYETAKDTAQEVQDCQREFNASLKSRARISAENDEISQTQRRILFDWIHRLIFPPPPYDKLDTNDPLRQQYGFTITIETEQALGRSFARQDELQHERDQNPLPDPTCGK